MLLIKLKSNFNNDISKQFLDDVSTGMYLRYYDKNNDYQICDILSVTTGTTEETIDGENVTTIQVMVNKIVDLVKNNDMVIGDYNNWLGRIEKNNYDNVIQKYDSGRREITFYYPDEILKPIDFLNFVKD